MHKHIYNRHTNEIKETKTKIHITAARCKTTITLEVEFQKIQLHSQWVIHSLKKQ